MAVEITDVQPAIKQTLAQREQVGFDQVGGVRALGPQLARQTAGNQLRLNLHRPQRLHIERQIDAPQLLFGLALVAAFVLLVVVTLVSVFADAPAGSVVVLIVVTIVCAAAVVSTLAFHVRVDAAGLTVNSIVGLPRVHVPLRDIASVEAVDVNPMGEFGGWGMRWAPGGGFGAVLRSGPGIRVHRTNGKVVTVTVEDAATGAALLGALAARAKA